MAKLARLWTAAEATLAFVGALSAILLLLVFWGCGRAAPQSSEAPPSQSLLEDAAYYAERYRVSRDEAVRRLQVQLAAGELEEALLAEERASFAGIWIEHEPAFRVVLSFTDTTSPRRSFPELDAMKGDVDIRSARWTLAELEAQQASAIALSTQMGVTFDSDINVRENRVEIYVVDKQEIDRLRTAVQKLSPSVLVIGVDRLMQPFQLDGGTALSTCTAGFTVRTATNDVGILTAGHCGNNQAAQGQALNFRKEDKEGHQDVQWHSACGVLDVSNRFQSGIGLRAVTGIRHRDQQTVGSMVCKFGSTTGRTCGNIVSKHLKPNSDSISNPSPTFVRVEGDDDDMVANFGDSGGPWYVETVAYGITVGGVSDDLNDAVYMPINYISSLGVSVLTSDPPGPACNLCSPTLCGNGRPPCCAGACKPSGLGGLMTCQQ